MTTTAPRGFAIFSTDHDERPDMYMYISDADTAEEAFREYEDDVGVFPYYKDRGMSLEEAMKDHVIREVPADVWEDWESSSGPYNHPPLDTLC
ncbi:hypothetical protein [Salinibacter ruber]|uniref:hypothetical protein n=1 Tax=Salinibacter ruber TaxID=146919 RepID=UPI0021698FB2|nr:hypothetical protein [Salinibacter ruber]MCS3610974.1 hypothetical protein [Salinibacter ruber]